jgi:hypothetical protein
MDESSHEAEAGIAVWLAAEEFSAVFTWPPIEPACRVLVGWRLNGRAGQRGIGVSRVVMRWSTCLTSVAELLLESLHGSVDGHIVYARLSANF